MPSGTVVYYYQTYDADGKRTVPRTTLQVTISAAKAYCTKLWKEDKLIPEVVPVRVPTLSEFGATFWTHWESEFLKYKEQRGYTISKAHAKNQARYFQVYIEPALGKKRLDLITPPMVEPWFLSLKDQGLSHQTCNHLLSNLRTILGEAMRRGIIASNPADAIKPLAKDSKTRGILAVDEVKTLFGPNAGVDYWTTSTYSLANLTAATTGMRMGEIQALRWCDIGKDRITVRHSWDRRFGLKTTKTAKERVIPLAPALRSQLLLLSANRTPEAFVFSNTRGETPVHEDPLLGSFYGALEKIGIDEAGRKERNITFHSWRHFFNTFLRKKGIHDSKVQMVTGHSSQDMTEHYTHFDIDDLKEVKAAQTAIWGIEEEDPEVTSEAAMTVQQEILKVPRGRRGRHFDGPVELPAPVTQEA
jgi:integrase